MRAMTLEDVDAVLAIEQEVQSYPWTRGNFMDALSNTYVCRVDSEELVAGHPEDGSAIRGYVVLMPVLDEAELLNIGVAAPQQRKGLGRTMLNEILSLARAKNLRRVFLEVRASNVAALALYRSIGFSGIGVRYGYYQNANCREDAITMACDTENFYPGTRLTGEINGQT